MTIIGNTRNKGAAAPVAPASPAPPGTIALIRPTPVKKRRSPIRIPRLARRVVGPVLVIAVWQLICSSGVWNSVEVASPVAVFDAARELWAQDQLQPNLLISLQRVVEGLVVGVAAGTALAVICGLFWIAEDLIDPVLQAFRAVPYLGLLPLAIIWFGVGELPKLFLIALGCLWPVYLNVFAAIRGVDQKLVEAGYTFGLNKWGLVRRVILPGSLPGFLVGLRFALVACWVADVVAEEINAQSGLGYLIQQAQTTDRTDIMFLCLAIYAILGLLADALVRLLQRFLLVWRSAFTGG